MKRSVIFCLLFAGMLNAQVLYSNNFTDIKNNINSNNSGFSFKPGLGLFADAVTIIKANTLSASVDFDLFRKESMKNYAFGLRGSIEHYSNLDLGGKVGGSPYTDYNLLGRFTIADEKTRFDLYSGIDYHTTSLPGIYKPAFLPKAGIEFRLPLSKRILYFIAKAGTSFKEDTTILGIGFSVGYDAF